MSPIMNALKQFEATEANLLKLQRLWDELKALFPASVPLDHNPEYEGRARSFDSVLRALPAIDGWKPNLCPPDLDGVAATRIDLLELDEPLETARFEAALWSEGRQIGEYRFRLDQKRRALIRDALLGVIDEFETCLQGIEPVDTDLPSYTELGARPEWQRLRGLANQIEVLLGSSVEKPPGWGYLRRHLSFGMVADLNDIRKADWPVVKAGLRKGLYGANEPVPVAATDLGELVAAKPRGPILTKLDWTKLDAEGFERLIYTLVSDQPGYENAAWLTRTNAPDRGRDVSVTRVITDPLSGTRRERVFIQCKHWPSKSVSAIDVGATKDQIALWTNPRADVLIIATTGRFSTDAVQWVEQHNERAAQPRIEIWPESHLERLLAARPALIAEFGLR
ncbi:restriction endonuclease [Methylobacterium sp. J-048]|uniref:restriction endonuclease n=1 Tax=Methylobacterium sp. J-048 TaxID=2836635 RepID=UPI001FB95725|nr:restriction endonuclease [Methylobacterium sp. J-048]MCJ2059812.1 restriction endonuclease [Methylobacterium sp. J-048]